MVKLGVLNRLARRAPGIQDLPAHYSLGLDGPIFAVDANDWPLKQQHRMAVVGATALGQRAPACQVLRRKSGKAASTALRLCSSSADRPFPVGLPVSQARCRATARSCPYSVTENALAKQRGPVAFDGVGGMRQPLARRSYARRGCDGEDLRGLPLLERKDGSRRSLPEAFAAIIRRAPP